MELRLLYSRGRRLLVRLLLLACAGIAPASAAGGRWELLHRSIGVSAMHMQLLHNDRVIIFDRTDFGRSNLSLPGGRCRVNPRDKVLPGGDCTAHSVEYHVASNSFRPLFLFTDTWCSSGTVAPDGTLVQTGGWLDGYNNTRTMPACAGDKSSATGPRSRTPSPPAGDGSLFIFASNRAILLDYKSNKVVRTYPVLAGGDPRNYPSTGSSVLLPLKPNPTEAEVLVCGGAPKGSYPSSRHRHVTRTFVPAGDVRADQDHRRLAGVGHRDNAVAAGDGRHDPAPERRAATGVPRLYHSSVVLLRDGRLLVGGSNPHIYYNFSDARFPTELSLEAFSPEYLDPSNDMLRPRILNPSPTGAAASVTYGAKLALKFSVPASARRRRRGGAGGGGSLGVVSVTMVAPSFTTHSFAMNQRLLVLEVAKTAVVRGLAGTYYVSATMPATAVLAPPGYYMVFVVNGHVPSEGIWVHVQ
ncbi:galactose oxidase-like [Panicum miliaceum]|uniref:Galactose oxidase-like n=1 Tax=Panicum miliaceum TaxID=4540 RepID=A0A3L6SAA2_PANMI|nr:galactose oxidase-like [Panicum miliaceum]